MADNPREYNMLAQRVTALEVHKDHTASAIEGLTSAVKELTGVMNKNKGAAGVLLWIAGSGGAMGAIALIKQLLK